MIELRNIIYFFFLVVVTLLFSATAYARELSGVSNNYSFRLIQDSSDSNVFGAFPFVPSYSKPLVVPDSSICFEKQTDLMLFYGLQVSQFSQFSIEELNQLIYDFPLLKEPRSIRLFEFKRSSKSDGRVTNMRGQVPFFQLFSKKERSGFDQFHFYRRKGEFGADALVRKNVFVGAKFIQRLAPYSYLMAPVSDFEIQCISLKISLFLGS